MIPFGLAMPIERVVGLLLMTAADTVRKWAVLPLSAMALQLGGMVIGGGPTKTVERLKPESLNTLGGVKVCSVVGVAGSPRRQLGAEVLAEAS